jgi:peptidyl-prolyl cis-trans isomerase D
MALIGKIRNNMWLVIILLALGLGGFVFMDISSVGGMQGNQQFMIGTVNGTDISWLDFQKAQEALYPGSDVDEHSQRDFVWSYYVDDAIIRQEAEGNGLSVGEEEMEELQFGTRLSPVVQRNFMDPQTGQVNRESLNQFRQAAQQGTLAPQYQRVWDFQQVEIVKDRLESKLVNLVRKGIYTPTWMAQDQQKGQGMRYDFKYVFIPFDQVDDSEINVTDGDYASYVRKHRAEFERQMEMRDAQYVVFDVFPTPEDSAAILHAFNELVTQFEETDNDSVFVTNLNGQYDIRYFKSTELSEVIVDSVFTIPVGDIYGPYIEEGDYRAVKVLDRKPLPDSVRSRHILIGVQTQEQVAGALALADSLETLLQEDITQFDTLAKQFSTDPGSGSRGGDLGFIALDAFVKPMNDLLFYRYTEPKKVYRVASQFGIHLVEVLEKKFETNTMGARIALINEPIIPSDLTQDFIYDEALEFAVEHRTLDVLLNTMNERVDLVLEEANNLPKSGYQFGTLPMGNTARDIVRWLFDPTTETGDVAPVVFTIEDDKNYFNAQYVVVALEEIHEKGLATPASIMDMIEAPVKNKKRGEVLASRITGTDLDAVALEFGVAIDTIIGVHIGISQMKDIGDEPDVLGTVLGLDVGQKAGPIVGRNGVYLVEVIDKVEGTVPQNLTQLRRQLTFQQANSAEFEVISSLRNNADIKDNRYTFF